MNLFLCTCFFHNVLSQVRVENVKDPDGHIPEILTRVRREYISKHYKIEQWTDARDFLEQVARRSGRLLKVLFFLNNQFSVLVLLITATEFDETFRDDRARAKGQSITFWRILVSRCMRMTV